VSGAENPFAPPETESHPGPVEDSAALRTRREYLETEVQVRALGSVFFVVGTVVLGWSASILVIVGRLSSRSVELLVPSVALGVSVAFLALGFFLRRLEPRAFWPAITGASVLLFTFPVGTPIGLYVLLVLLRPKSRQVLSAHYAEVRRATPFVVYRTPMLVWALLGLVLVSFTALVLGWRFWVSR
jgi:hypothetical protein